MTQSQRLTGTITDGAVMGAALKGEMMRSRPWKRRHC